ncbi:glycosyltransferase family 2 protein [Halomonas binhaiensis]|nr:glycosyltransferase family 2 protein [Halomonas binhaiensis]
MMTHIELSVLIPAHNEAGNLPALLDEIALALSGITPVITPVINYEVLVMDDGSSDDTWSLLVQRAQHDKHLRPLRHSHSAGQSTSVWQAAQLARGTWLATLDGDGQNDPADIPALMQAAIDEDAVLVGGHRVVRQDTKLKLLSSRIANNIRRRLLDDDSPDSGCGIKVIRRDAFLSLPYFDHMHRFLPALIHAQGGKCLARPVNHRERGTGQSHYGLGNRLWVGIVDLMGVMWLKRRSRLPALVTGIEDSELLRGESEAVTQAHEESVAAHVVSSRMEALKG